jgi:hypothetical protein
MIIIEFVDLLGLLVLVGGVGERRIWRRGK